MRRSARLFDKSSATANGRAKSADRTFTQPSFDPPAAVRRHARIGLQLKRNGFAGGTQSGWNRARQLSDHDAIPIGDLAVMRAWFARHGPDAANGGTSYRGYRRWVEAGKPMRPKSATAAQLYRGAVAWLLWGGDPAYRWLKSNEIRTELKRAFPNKKEAKRGNFLTV